MDKKRRHHHVWQYYLSAWSNADGRVACLRKKGAIFSTAPSNLAVRTDYYRLREMTETDLKFVEAIAISPAPQAIQPVLRGWIPTFTAVFQLRDQLEQKGLDTTTGESARLFDTVINNLEEDLHATIEGRAISWLDALRCGDLSFLRSADELAGFLHYLAVQYVRTTKQRDSMVAAQRDAPARVENCWGLLSHVVATTLAHVLFVRQKQLRIELLHATSGAQFVTTDQPVVNTHAFDISSETEVQELTLFYPISPDLAVLVSMSEEPGQLTGDRGVSRADVGDYNRAMTRHAHEQTYAASELELAELLTP